MQVGTTFKNTHKIIDKYPIVIVPSFIGNILQAKDTNKKSVHLLCPKNKNWYTLWMNNDNFKLFTFDCWLEDFALYYNASTGKYGNYAGVSVTCPDYGGVEAVYAINPEVPNSTITWAFVTNALYQIGYEAGKDIRAAPYDWRVGPDQYENQFERLKLLIEDTYQINKNKQVIVTSLSLGGPYVSLFLNRYVSEEWKTKYIKAFVPFSGAWSGTALSALFTINIKILFEKLPKKQLNLLQEAIRSFGSLIWLLPFPSSSIIVSTPKKNYTAAELYDIFVSLGITSVIRQYKDILPYMKFTAPNVETYCIYGYNITTPSSFYFKDFAQLPDVFFSEGDGTAILESIQICTKWAKQQSQPVYDYKYINVQHSLILREPQVISDFLSIVTR